MNLTSPVGRLFANMLMGFAQLERELISGRVAEAVAWKASKGYHTGKVPYGYRAVPAPDGCKYKVDPERQGGVVSRPGAEAARGAL
jgi:DNA invertase Pin-like site-specific DNA recombinase